MSPLKQTASQSPGSDLTRGLRAKSRNLGESAAAFALIAPALLVLCGLFLYPLILGIGTSLGAPAALSFKHYVHFLADRRSFVALINTLEIAVLSTLGSVVVSLPLVLLMRRSQRYRNVMRALMIIPLMVPVMVSAYAVSLFFAQNGLFNNLLVGVLHLIPSRLQISYTFSGIILACIWRYFPFVAITLAGALEGLDSSLEEAAASMGASPSRAFRDVMFPLLVPSITTGSMMVFAGTFGTFSIPLIMGGGQDVLSVVAYRYQSVFFDRPAASTVATIMLVVQILVLSVYTRRMRRPVQ